MQMVDDGGNDTERGIDSLTLVKLVAMHGNISFWRHVWRRKIILAQNDQLTATII